MPKAVKASKAAKPAPKKAAAAGSSKATKKAATAKVAKSPAKAAKKAAPAKATKAPAKTPAKTPAKAAKAVPKKTAPAPAKTAKKAAPPTKASPPVSKTPTAKAATKTAPAKAATKTATKAAAPVVKKAPGKVVLDKFVLEQRELLHEERRSHTAQADALRAEADALAQEMEPGDAEFGEEGGEGGTLSIDRERDLMLSAQARMAVEEIDAALAKIPLGTYGLCESCGKHIAKPRLKAIPYARLCMECKQGGLSRR